MTAKKINNKNNQSNITSILIITQIIILDQIFNFKSFLSVPLLFETEKQQQYIAINTNLILIFE